MTVQKRLLAIDPSLTGFATVLQSQNLDITEAELSTKSAQTLSGRMKRLEKLVSHAASLVRVFCPEVVFIEGYSFGSKGRAVISLAELGGVLRYELAKFGIPIIEVPPTSLKKFVCGKGNANKVMVSSALSHQYGRTFKSDNAADAFGLAKLGATVLGWIPVLYKYQEDTVDALRKLIQQEKQE